MAFLLADVCFAKLIREARQPEMASITVPGTRGFKRDSNVAFQQCGLFCSVEKEENKQNK